MKVLRAITYLRDCDHFVMNGFSEAEFPVEFTLKAIHLAGENSVIVIKHDSKVVAIARKIKEFRAQRPLKDLSKLAISQIDGPSQSRVWISIEYDSSHRPHHTE